MLLTLIATKLQHCCTNIEFITEDYCMITNVYLGIVYTFSYFCRNRQKQVVRLILSFQRLKWKNQPIYVSLFPLKWFLKKRKIRYPRQIFMGNLPDAFFYVLLKIADLVLTVHLGGIEWKLCVSSNFIIFYLVYQNTLWISIPFHANVVFATKHRTLLKAPIQRSV